MSASNFAGLKWAKPEPPCVVAARKARNQADRDRRQRAKVRARDGNSCRCCRRRKAREVHEVQYRSKGGKVCTANSVHLCRTCHALIHASLILVLGNDANGELSFIRR